MASNEPTLLEQHIARVRRRQYVEELAIRHAYRENPDAMPNFIPCRYDRDLLIAKLATSHGVQKISQTGPIQNRMPNLIIRDPDTSQQIHIIQEENVDKDINNNNDVSKIIYCETKLTPETHISGPMETSNRRGTVEQEELDTATVTLNQSNNSDNTEDVNSFVAMCMFD